MATSVLTAKTAVSPPITKFVLDMVHAVTVVVCATNASQVLCVIPVSMSIFTRQIAQHVEMGILYY